MKINQTNLNTCTTINFSSPFYLTFLLVPRKSVFLTPSLLTYLLVGHHLDPIKVLVNARVFPFLLAVLALGVCAFCVSFQGLHTEARFFFWLVCRFFVNQIASVVQRLQKKCHSIRGIFECILQVKCYISDVHIGHSSQGNFPSLNLPLAYP